ncbi:MAG: hypothetical protein HUK15_06380 [Bacteroidales bacterium]|nr:hypothetical protein [Bacteroidales bacterium]
MKKITVIVAVLAMFAIVFSNCKKYEEDYGLMLKTPKSRLVGNWYVSQIDSDTISIKMSDFSMFGELNVSFAKDETGAMKFIDKGIGDYLADIDWEEIMDEYQGDVDMGGLGGSLDFASLLSQEIAFNWNFNKEKTYINFTSAEVPDTLKMEILSLCSSDMKLRFYQDSVTMSVSFLRK